MDEKEKLAALIVADLSACIRSYIERNEARLAALEEQIAEPHERLAELERKIKLLSNGGMTYGRVEY